MAVDSVFGVQMRSLSFGALFEGGARGAGGGGSSSGGSSVVAAMARLPCPGLWM